MLAFIKKIFLKCRKEKTFQKDIAEDDVGTVKRVVRTMLNIHIGDPFHKNEYILPFKEKHENCNNSEDYIYLRLISALRAFKGEKDWEKYNSFSFIHAMISENISEEKKKQFMDIIGELSPRTQTAIQEHDIFGHFERMGMVQMLLGFIYSAERFDCAWTRYSSFDIGGSLIYSFMKNSSIKYMSGPVEQAFTMICLLLGDDYDTPISTKELCNEYSYPTISNKKLGDMAYEEEYC